MPRYIDAEKIEYDKHRKIGLGIDYGLNESDTYYTATKEKIDAIPTADVRKNVHGKWIVKDESYWRQHYSGDIQVNKAGLYCSKCDKRLAKAQKYKNFCPNCGADMRERRDDGEN